MARGFHEPLVSNLQRRPAQEAGFIVRLNYAIVFVLDMARSIAFYRDIVGAPLRFESPEWTEFETGSATLALHKGEPGATRGDSQGPADAGQCRPGFNVDDMDAFHSKMLDHNVAVVQSPRDVFGSRIAQYRDPDGLIISVSEARRDFN